MPVVLVLGKGVRGIDRVHLQESTKSGRKQKKHMRKIQQEGWKG